MKTKDVRRLELYGRRAIAVLVLSGVTFVFVRGAFRMYERYAAASEARDAAELEVEALKERQADLETKVASLSSDRGLEEELRRRFGVGKPGEGVIELLEEAAPPTQEAREGGLMGWIKRIF
jgi:cell division protein FtsB